MLVSSPVPFHIYVFMSYFFFFFSSRRRHTRFDCDWSSDVCSSDLEADSRAGLSSAFSLRYRQGLARSRTPSTTRWLPPDPLIAAPARLRPPAGQPSGDRKSTRLNSSHSQISYAVFCLKKKKNKK